MVKKKNKLIILLCSFCLIFTSVFGLICSINSSDYSVFALSDTKPIINETYFDFKDANFINKFDAYVTTFSLSSSGGYMSIEYTLNKNLKNNTSLTTISRDFYIYTLHNDNSIANITSKVSSISFYGNIIILNCSSVVTSQNSSLFDNKIVVCFQYNSKYYTVCNKVLYLLYDAYNLGLSNNGGYDDAYADGQNSVINNPNNYDLYNKEQYDNNYNLGYQDGYNAGVTKGQNDVLNNPNDFGLYTKEQYDNNYQNGYSKGIIDGQNNVVNNPNDYNLYDEEQYNQNYKDGQQSTDAYQNGYNTGVVDGQNYVLNNPNNYDLYTVQEYNENYNKGYKDGSDSVLNIYTGYGIFLNASYSIVLNPDTILHTGSINSNDTYFDKLNGGVVVNDNFIDAFYDDYEYGGGYIEFKLNELVSVSQYDTFNFNNFAFGNYVKFYLNNGVVIGFNNADLSSSLQSYSLIGYEKYNIEKIQLGFANRDYLVKIGVSSNTLNSGVYSQGFNDGVDSIDQSGIYNKGYNDGTKVGYQTGLAEGVKKGNDYTFFGLISAVIDAPINSFKSLFNFDLLGFNMFNFFTSIVTACIVIWLIKLVIGGK